MRIIEKGQLGWISNLAKLAKNYRLVAPKMIEKAKTFDGLINLIDGIEKEER